MTSGRKGHPRSHLIFAQMQTLKILSVKMSANSTAVRLFYANSHFFTINDIIVLCSSNTLNS